jgi:triosephosphate isomerase (TIM)
MAQFYCVGNWKMNKGPREAKEFFAQLKAKARSEEFKSLIVLPPAISAQAVSEAVAGIPVLWGGQNCHFEAKGAFTGETSGAVLKELGAVFCLVGHSERRHIFSESDELLSKKVAFLQSIQLTPILCVGETNDDRKWGRTKEVILRQLKQCLSAADKAAAIWIAYEPVWAIGTGNVATSEQVEEVHTFIRNYLNEFAGQSGAEIPILYGGSVKPDNVQWLAQIQDVNGFLIGGASLNAEEFLSTLRNASPA